MMAAFDYIHDAVRNALLKDGWTITADPFHIPTEDFTLHVDLAAERPIAAEKAGRKIAVEIKSFLGHSQITDFERALGQYEIYRTLLDRFEGDRKLYLAVPSATFDDFFSLETIQYIVCKYNVAILVIDVDKEQVVAWTR
jgi:hypothetical protein